MEARVLPPPSPPKQKMILELDPAEFAVLYTVHYRHTDGNCSLRRKIDGGMSAALRMLHPSYQEVIRVNRSSHGRTELLTNQIERAFNQIVF